MEPTTPEMHWAITIFGLLMMNKGEPMMGRGRLFSGAGSLDMGSPKMSKTSKNIEKGQEGLIADVRHGKRLKRREKG